MGLSLKVFAEKLGHHSPELFLSDETHSSIASARLLAHGNGPGDSEILYIGNLSELAGILPVNNSINVLCVADGEILSEYTQNQHLNLLVLHTCKELQLIFNEIQDIFSEACSLAPNYEILLDTLIHERDINRIMDIGYQLLGNPICFINLSGKLLACSNRLGTDGLSYWNELIEHERLSYETMYIVIPENLNQQEEKNRAPITSRAVLIENILVGYILVSESRKPIGNGDLEIISLLCNLVSLRVQQSENSEGSKKIIYENLIRSLLEGDKKYEDMIVDWAKALSSSAKDNFFILTIVDTQFHKSDLHLTYLIHLMKLLENIIRESKCVIYQNNIVLLVNYASENPLNDVDLSSLREVLKRYNLKGGLSHCFHNVMDVYCYYVQSLKAIEFGLFNGKGETLFQYHDYALDHFMDIGSHTAGLAEFCHPALFVLMEYDSKNNTSFTHTLYQYILNNKNQIKSAKALNIHRTTLIYRIEKMEELINLKLNNFNLLHRLYLSFIILKHINKLPFNPIQQGL